ncbi:hypothetical protein MPSEU_000636600 [Mayamaea pseudoterrestris]|nr:hypothetical protein MPSEU_000636600 [Mayamaea pseudoterrestris]
MIRVKACQTFVQLQCILALLTITQLPTTSSSLAWSTTAGARATARSSPETISFRTNDCTTKTKVRIRSSVATDLPAVAEMLATASIQLTAAPSRRPRIGFMAQLDRLWAQKDIHQLLLVRHKAIQEAKKRMPRREATTVITSKSRLSVLWKSDSFRTLVHRAATETGEPNLWKHHDYYLPPASIDWLQHIQMTACDDNDRVIAFCEIAMLSNPTQSHDAHDNSQIARNNFSPAILNLCVDPLFRRQGMAKRIIARAERYVWRYWQVDSLGLYVHANNEAAMSLYRRMGYREPRLGSKALLDDSGDAQKMLYMQKRLDKPHHGGNHADRTACT